MKRYITLLLCCCFFYTHAQITGPDTVCAGSTVTFGTPDTSTTYTWDFNTVSVVQPISPFSLLYTTGGTPAFSRFCKDGSNYYVFVTDYFSSQLRRLDYGTTFPGGTPTVTVLGSCGITASLMEDIDIVKDPISGNWYGILVASGQVSILSFGSSLSSTPTFTMYSLTGLFWAHQATIKRYQGQWIAFIADRNSTIKRLDFGTSLTNPPVMTTIPNVGTVTNPCNFTLYEQSGNWYMLVTSLITGRLSRYDFGTNLLNNAPTGTWLPSPVGMLNLPRNINLLNDCQNHLIGYIINETGNVTRVDFAGNITTMPTFTSMGSSGVTQLNSATPCSYGTSFAFLVVSYSGSIRMFNPLVLAPPAFINYYNPTQPYAYPTPGVYSLSLFEDMGYTSGPKVLCKSVTVIAGPPPIVGNTPMCVGNNITLSNGLAGGTWSCAPSSVATISSTGLVTGVASGTATVSYLTACGPAMAIVTVSPCICNTTVSLPDSLFICVGNTVTMPTTLTTTDPLLSVIWTPPTGLSSSTILNPVLTGTTSGWYTVTASTILPLELIVNGDFSAGNTGFSSSYTNVTGPSSLFPVNTYAISSNPNNEHPLAASFFDHTVGTSAGKMMAVNGATSPNTFWCQTVPVTPNTNYILSSWLTNWSSDTTGNFPIIRYEINGIPIGTGPFTFVPTPGLWTKYQLIWNSGTSTSASICIRNSQIAASGNDFSIDDISFKKICAARDSVYVKIAPAPGPITGSAPICIGENITLSHPSPGGTWSCSPSSVATISTTGVVTGSSAGVATITYMTTCGSVYASVLVKPTPTVNATVNSPCEGDTILFTATAPPSATFSWSGPAGFTSTISNPYIYPSSSLNIGTYFVRATVAGCTSAPFPVTVTIIPIPVITKITFNDPTACLTANGWIKLHGLSGGQSYTVNYIYNGTSVSVTLTADASGNILIPNLGIGTYTDFFVISSSGCISNTVGPVTLDFNVKPSVISFNKPLCEGAKLMLKATDPMWGGAFLWSYPDGGSSTEQNPVRYNVPLSASGVYTLTYTVDTCVSRDTADIHIYPYVVLINVTPDQTISYGSSVRLNAEGALYYLWPGEATISNPVINNPVATPSVTTTYTIYGMNEGGCPDTARVTITVDDQDHVFIPTGFTPNGDGLNDVFKIRGNFHSLVEFSIYNRYGERVYHNTYNKDAGWDGIWNGQPSELGTYMYYVIVGHRDGSNETFKGDVTLVR